jgi:hypothetical protein
VEGHSLCIEEGKEGARLTHSHCRQYHYVLQSLHLWRAIITDFFKVCCVLCAVCCVLCAVCCVLCAMCCVLCAVCCVLCAACCVLCAVCCVLCAVCCVLCAMCCVLCAMCCVLCAVCAVCAALLTNGFFSSGTLQTVTCSTGLIRITSRIQGRGYKGSKTRPGYTTL